MHALVYQGPGRSSWERVPDPAIVDPGDVIVRTTATTVCGTDLHIRDGDVPDVRPGTVLGHEAVGEVVEVGPAVRAVRPGDRVVVSCVSGCGHCRSCRAGAYGQCLGGGGWVLGHRIDGTQAEYVRVPFADLAAHPLPGAVSDQDALLLSDVLPTAYEVGVRAGGVRPGDTVVVVGAGPVGLAVVATARLFAPRRVVVVEPSPRRLEAARVLGADVLADPAERPEALVADLTAGLGAEVVVEAVGRPETFELCTRLVGPRGRVANVGVHGRPATLHLETLWSRSVTISTGLVDTVSTPTLLALLADGQLALSALLTHEFALGEIDAAYRAFADPAGGDVLKVLLRAEPARSRELVTTERSRGDTEVPR